MDYIIDMIVELEIEEFFYANPKDIYNIYKLREEFRTLVKQDLSYYLLKHDIEYDD